MQISHDFIATKSCPAHQVLCNIPTFEALLRKICTCFSKDAEGLITLCSSVVPSEQIVLRMRL